MDDILAITSKLGLGTVNAETGDYTQCDSGDSGVSRAKDFFGITWDDNFLYTLGREANHIKKYDRDLRYLGSLHLPEKLADGHQILWIEKYKQFVLTDAEKDMVMILDPETDNADIVHISSPGIEHSHVNTLYFDENKDLIYINCHNKGDSCVIIYQYPELSKPVDEKWIGIKSHNIWFENNLMHMCSSGRKEIIDENGSVKLKCMGFVRGAAVTDDRIYAGQSGWRQTDGKYKFHGIGKKRCASIMVLDRSYNLLKEIFLPPRIKEIFDVRILNRFDYSHNKKPFLHSLQEGL